MIVAIKPQQQVWQKATWDDYVALRDDDLDRYKLFFDNQHFWLEMGAEGINHSKFGDLFVMILFILAAKFLDRKLQQCSIKFTTTRVAGRSPAMSFRC